MSPLIERESERERERQIEREKKDHLTQPRAAATGPTLPPLLQTMAGSSPPAGGVKRASDGDPEAPSASAGWQLTRSAVLASLAPFFLLSMGHYFSVSSLLVQFAVRRRRWRGWLRSGGEYVWAFEDSNAADAVAFVWTEMAGVVVSFAVLCLSWAATIGASAAINSGRRLTAGELFSKMRAVLVRGEPATTRTYSAVLLLGYILSVILVIAVVLLVSGDKLSWSVMQFVICSFAFLLCAYLVVAQSVGAGAYSPEGGGEGGVDALWRAAALMEARVLQWFFVFFLSLLATHGPLVVGGSFGSDFYGVDAAAVALLPGPVLIDAVWTVGTCCLFGYAGFLLQV